MVVISSIVAGETREMGTYTPRRYRLTSMEIATPTGRKQIVLKSLFPISTSWMQGQAAIDFIFGFMSASMLSLQLMFPLILPP